MSWYTHLTKTQKTESKDKINKGDDEMKYGKMKKQRKICVNVTCPNDAPKDSVYCKVHRKAVKKTWSSGYVSKTGCHTGNKLVFTTPEGIQVYGGGSSRDGGWWKMQPLPDLAIGVSEVVNKDVSLGSHKVPEGWKVESTTRVVKPHIVSIDWPDYSIPKGIGREFWLALVEDIYTHGIKTVSCQCIGGHGRTGVQLAILAHYLLPESQHTWKDAGQLVQWVRKHMCVHEVEAITQQQYIANVCGLPMGEGMVAEQKAWSGYSQYAQGTHDDWWQEQANHYDKKEVDDSQPQTVMSVDEKKAFDILLDNKDRILECIKCEAQEVIDTEDLEIMGSGMLLCIECKIGEMIDVTDMPETQAMLNRINTNITKGSE